MHHKILVNQVICIHEINLNGTSRFALLLMIIFNNLLGKQNVLRDVSRGNEGQLVHTNQILQNRQQTICNNLGYALIKNIAASNGPIIATRFNLY
jgi:hypothetical protein